MISYEPELKSVEHVLPLITHARLPFAKTFVPEAAFALMIKVPFWPDAAEVEDDVSFAEAELDAGAVADVEFRGEGAGVAGGVLVGLAGTLGLAILVLEPSEGVGLCALWTGTGATAALLSSSEGFVELSSPIKERTIS